MFYLNQIKAGRVTFCAGTHLIKRTSDHNKNIIGFLPFAHFSSGKRWELEERSGHKQCESNYTKRFDYT